MYLGVEGHHKTTIFLYSYDKIFATHYENERSCRLFLVLWDMSVELGSYCKSEFELKLNFGEILPVN